MKLVKWADEINQNKEIQLWLFCLKNGHRNVDGSVSIDTALIPSELRPNIPTRIVLEMPK